MTGDPSHTGGDEGENTPLNLPSSDEDAEPLSIPPDEPLEEEVEPTLGQAPPMMELARFIDDVTSGGLFPILAHGLDPNGASDSLGLATTLITDLPFALDLLERIHGEKIHPYRFVPLAKLRYITSVNRTLTFREQAVAGL